MNKEHKNRKYWFSTAVSVSGAIMLFMAPAAWADGGKGSGSSDHGGRDATQHVSNSGPGKAQTANSGAIQQPRREGDEDRPAPGVLPVRLRDNDDAPELERERAEAANPPVLVVVADADEKEAAREAREANALPAELDDDGVIRLGDNRGPGHAPEFAIPELVTLLNDPAAQIASVSGANVNEDEHDAEPGFRVLSVVSLPTVVAPLTAADAAAVNAAATNNSAQVQTFLTGDSGVAAVLRTVLTDAGIDPHSVLALLSNDDQRLVVVTTA